MRNEVGSERGASTGLHVAYSDRFWREEGGREGGKLWMYKV